MMPDSARVPSVPLVARGVYHLPWTGPGGERFIAAVNRAGQLLFQATVYDAGKIRAAELALWQILDREDPPHLRLLT